MEAILLKTLWILLLLVGVIGLTFVIILLLKFIYDFVAEIIDDILDNFRR